MFSRVCILKEMRIRFFIFTGESGFGWKYSLLDRIQGKSTLCGNYTLSSGSMESKETRSKTDIHLIQRKFNLKLLQKKFQAATIAPLT